MIGNREESDSAADDKILENAQVRIRAKTPNQKKYHQAILDNEIVFAIGPAGTGKTFIAVAAAVAQFQRGAVERIVLVRPVVEAGEKLGYLPGDIKEKVDPFFKPLYDALFYMLPPEQVKKYIDREVFEIAPLAYMRGRTLNHAIVILDEAQNTTNMQMKMFLTRLGVNSRAIITGDITQIDLENPNTSGLKQAADILKNVIGIGFVYLDSNDVVRHKLVSDIIRAYNDYKN
ncbi:PhoH family protein [bacterium]|nr:PhoH family protein [FCB group bacterium]MBL7191592.1 PhoH family protein [bacterium]